MMYPLFQLLARKFGNTEAWYSGLVLYWIIWGGIYPLSMLGRQAILGLIWPPRMETTAILLAAIPIVFAAGGRLFFGVQYEKPVPWTRLTLLATALGNGLFEEILWRGTYLTIFPDSLFFSVIWPSLWFAAWHSAPGSVSSSGNVRRLVLGAVFFGLLLGFLAWQTDSIFWCILAHTLAGIVLVV